VKPAFIFTSHWSGLASLSLLLWQATMQYTHDACSRYSKKPLSVSPFLILRSHPWKQRCLVISNENCSVNNHFLLHSIFSDNADHILHNCIGFQLFWLSEWTIRQWQLLLSCQQKLNKVSESSILDVSCCLPLPQRNATIVSCFSAMYNTYYFHHPSRTKTKTFMPVLSAFMKSALKR